MTNREHFSGPKRGSVLIAVLAIVLLLSFIVTRFINEAVEDLEYRAIFNEQNKRPRRLDYRTKEWDVDFLAYVKGLEKIKPVVFCGDLNVAHTEIDLANPKTNRKNAGFTDEERSRFDAIVEAGFVDSFRHLYPDTTERYTWWSYRAAARKRNIGWRIDYFCVSEGIKDHIAQADILDQVEGSDHCPVVLELAPKT
jgi:exodeoxyribonuclease-3